MTQRTWKKDEVRRLLHNYFGYDCVCRGRPDWGCTRCEAKEALKAIAKEYKPATKGGATAAPGGAA